MRKLVYIILLISLSPPFSVYAGGHGGSDSKNIDELPVDNSKIKKLLWDDDSNNGFHHLGKKSAINLLHTTALLQDHSLREKNSLEIGCRNGSTANFLYQSGYKKLWAIDINKHLIKEAKEKYTGINFNVLDVTKLTKEFEEDFFSFIISLNITHAVKSKVTLLQRLKAISNSGTILALSDYYLKDEENTEIIKNLSGKIMHPIKLRNFKMLMKVLGWDILEEIDITDKYKIWCNDIISNIKKKTIAQKIQGYTEEEINTAIKRLESMIEKIDTNKIGGIILIAKKV